MSTAEPPASEQPNSPLPNGASESSAPIAPAAEASPAPTVNGFNEPATGEVYEPLVPPPPPPPPGGVAFDGHGAPIASEPIAVRTVTYVDRDGQRIEKVKVLASRKDGGIDIEIPAGITSYRVDGVRRRETDEQKGHFYE